MIARLDGTVLAAVGQQLVVGVGGIGIAVNVTPQRSLAARTGSTIALHTTLIVREDDLSLYGFDTAAELTMFDLLRGVTGVGPKSALGVLGAMTPEQLADAVAGEDDAAFRKVSGIGPKTAKLIILQLAGKVAAPRPGGASAPDFTAAVLVALTGLGWPERQASAALEQAVSDAQSTGGETADLVSVGSLLRASLAVLGPAR